MADSSEVRAEVDCAGLIKDADQTIPAWQAPLVAVVLVCLGFGIAYFDTVSGATRPARQGVISSFFHYWFPEPWRADMNSAVGSASEGNIVVAEPKFRSALQKARSSGSVLAQYEVLEAFGDYWLAQGKHGESPAYLRARECFEQAVPLALKRGSTFDKTHALERLGEVDERLGMLSSSEQALSQAVALLEKSPGSDNVHLASMLLKLAVTQKELGEFQQARLNNSRAIELLSKTPEKANFIASGHWENARCYLGEQNYVEADKAFRQAESTLDGKTDSLALDDLTKILHEHAALLLRMGRDSEADALVQRANKL